MNPIEEVQFIPIDAARTRLAAIWLAGGFSILGIVVVQSLLGRFGDTTGEVWNWLLPAVLPTLGMIVTVSGYTALDPRYSKAIVRASFFRMASWLSGFYLALVLLTILIQPFTASQPVELMKTSNLWLGPFQGVVSSALGVLFVSKQQKPGEEKQDDEARTADA